MLVGANSPFAPVDQGTIVCLDIAALEAVCFFLCSGKNFPWNFSEYFRIVLCRYPAVEGVFCVLCVTVLCGCNLGLTQ